jgi:hypothetical protein
MCVLLLSRQENYKHGIAKGVNWPPFETNHPAASSGVFVTIYVLLAVILKITVAAFGSNHYLSVKRSNHHSLK